ncbi:hypothetical protein E4U14_008078 [Claviceps sp. LM454 group G7]|nr:hypothetical protein E4U14_008078 [Claviceps sp. LM454 group G7]
MSFRNTKYRVLSKQVRPQDALHRIPESAFLPKISRRHLEESICLPCGPVVGTTVAFQQLNKLEIA